MSSAVSSVNRSVLVDRQQARQAVAARVACQRVGHAIEKRDAVLDRAHDDVAVAARTEAAESSQRDQERIAPAFQRGARMSKDDTRGGLSGADEGANRFPPLGRLL
jgi:hypothetical protein